MLFVALWLLCMSYLLDVGSSVAPSMAPTMQPTLDPTAFPTRSPARLPITSPTMKPTLYMPSLKPSVLPSSRPTSLPSPFAPSPPPTSQPTSRPSSRPSIQPTRQPTSQPTSQPSQQPTTMPSNPTSYPSSRPTDYAAPTSRPTSHTRYPTYSLHPTVQSSPTRQPTTTRQPTIRPTTSPTIPPTMRPSQPTIQPTGQPSGQPTSQPSRHPSSQPSSQPTHPTSRPTSQPTGQPNSAPSFYPSVQPTNQPTARPSSLPSSRPSKLEANPVHQPTSQPSTQPTGRPSVQPSSRPSGTPTVTKRPTNTPSGRPSFFPIGHPTSIPSDCPSSRPSTNPTHDPNKTIAPTFVPTAMPSMPTSQPTDQPTSQPTSQPSSRPSTQPSAQPSKQPTSQPSSRPTSPTGQPSGSPSSQPSSQPSSRPSHSHSPSSHPSSRPSSLPSTVPSSRPSFSPTNTRRPTIRPSLAPFDYPTSFPTQSPSYTLSPTAFFQQMGTSGYAYFQPDMLEPCYPLELTLVVKFARNLTAGSTFVVNTPGLTSGACYSEVNGKSINSLFMPSSATLVSGRYSEGIYSTSFETSKITFLVLATFIAGEPYTIVIDRQNELRRTCSANTTWIVTTTPVGRETGQTGFLDRVETYPRQGYLHYSEVNFSNARPQFMVDINVSFRLAFPITRGTILRVKLPSFTNRISRLPMSALGNNTRLTRGTDAYLQGLTTNFPYSWIGHWFEGNVEDMFSTSYLELVSQGSVDYNGNYWVKIPKSKNHIIPLCGAFANTTRFTLTVNSTYFAIPEAPFQKANGIGSTCDEWSSCNGHGDCDDCTGKCTCADGYGSTRDKLFAVVDTFKPDCSARACPLGRALGTVYKYGKTYAQPLDGQDNHRLMECSNLGQCDRSTGRCVCPVGYAGPACEQQVLCQGSPLCGGRGQCLSMRRLSARPDTFPLSFHEVNYVDLLPSHSAWDGDFGQACVCDSTWPVGLGPGEVQASEYFGAGCEYRHCPSGNDPMTRVNETNCEGKNLLGGFGLAEYDLGQRGNLCHVDCSNRGVCDYLTGVCACYPGFTGGNCGRIAR